MQNDLFTELDRYGIVTTEFERLPLDTQDRLQQLRDKGAITMRPNERDTFTIIKVA